MKGNHLREARKLLNMSQEELGTRFGVNKRTIWLQEKSEEVAPVYAYAISYLLIRDRTRHLLDELSSLP